MKQAGYDSIDLKIHLADTAFEGCVDAGTLYAETARPAGINIEVVRTTTGEVLSGQLNGRPIETGIASGGNLDDVALPESGDSDEYTEYQTVSDDESDWRAQVLDHHRQTRHACPGLMLALLLFYVTG